MSKKYLWVLLILILPTFSLMLKNGIYTMHDFHVFRQQQFDKCLRERYFPCRWAADAGLGYGEPVFNFYGQFPYWVGQIFRTAGLQIIDSVKINFILTLVLSAVAMFFLARRFWGNLGGTVSALFYVYAPYRAVDVWVRGALSEAYSFVFLPVIFLSLDTFLQTRSRKSFFWLTLSLTGLLITHNLSFLMLAPFLGIWIVFRLWGKSWRPHLTHFFCLPLLVFLLSSFYLLPVIFESFLVTVGQTTQNYYNYRIHFTTLYQLFVSRFWGYGGSTWGPNDTMSFSIGHLHWVIAALLVITALVSKKLTHHKSLIIILSLMGLLAIFLTHGKSEIIWRLLPPLSFIQFPWRFLTFSTFFLSLLSGAIALVFPKKILIILINLVILINFNFFRPDIWRSITDTQQFSGPLWDEQRSSALRDFWPKSASQLPTDFAFSGPKILLDTSEYQKIQYPIVYFPGWKSQVDLFPSGPLGLITARVPLDTQITLKFTDTPVRTIGNWTSLIALFSFLIWRLKLPRPNGRGIFNSASSELKSSEAENISASHDLTIGKFREGGLKYVQN